MPIHVNLIGQRYGRLLVIDKTKSRRGGDGQMKGYWLCQCDCGRQIEVVTGALRGNLQKSCGCLKSESTIKRFTKHGQASGSRTLTYQTWKSMIKRCTNPNEEKYKYYGGRGITICERWKKFENFFEDMGEKPRGMSIDRINSDGDYCKENCRWATQKEQVANRRTPHTNKLTQAVADEIRAKYLNGSKQKTLAVEYGVCKGTIANVCQNRVWCHD